MNGMNFDLYRAMSGQNFAHRPLDPHAHHLAEHLAALRAARRARWRDRLMRLRALLVARVTPAAPAMAPARCAEG
ncbi:MAG: hypothetical protein ACT4N9_09750 [Paracoccaceae bacterium]